MRWMRGSETNRKKLAKELCAIGINARELERSVMFGAHNNILFEDGRGAPTLIEYEVSWYTENIKGDAEEVAERVKEIMGGDHKEELRELRLQFMKLRDHIAGIGLPRRPEGIKPDQAFIDKAVAEIKEELAKLTDTEVGYKAIHLLNRYATVTGFHSVYLRPTRPKLSQAPVAHKAK